MSEPKRPRDWLLARHAPVAAELDALRRAMLPAAPMTWGDLGREIFRPHRRVWRALAIVWAGLIAFYFTLGHSPRRTQDNTPSAEAVAAWLAQLKTHETFAQINRSH